METMTRDLMDNKRLNNLRIHDLIAKTAHVSMKNTLRVLIALRVVAEEYDLDPYTILGLRYSFDKPTPEQAQQCEIAYTWMYGNEDIAKGLFEIEQLS